MEINKTIEQQLIDLIVKKLNANENGVKFEGAYGVVYDGSKGGLVNLEQQGYNIIDKDYTPVIVNSIPGEIEPILDVFAISHRISLRSWIEFKNTEKKVDGNVVVESNYDVVLGVINDTLNALRGSKERITENGQSVDFVLNATNITPVPTQVNHNGKTLLGVDYTIFTNGLDQPSLTGSDYEFRITDLSDANKTVELKTLGANITQAIATQPLQNFNEENAKEDIQGSSWQCSLVALLNYNTQIELDIMRQAVGQDQVKKYKLNVTAKGTNPNGTKFDVFNFDKTVFFKSNAVPVVLGAYTQYALVAVETR